MNTEYRLSGLTCEHCVKAVTNAVMAVPDVTNVAIDLADQSMVVTSTQPIDYVLLEAAVFNAGDGDYTVSKVD